jgi:hypothetical protein
MPGTIHGLDIPLIFRLTWKCFPGPKKSKSAIAPCRRRRFECRAQIQNRLDPLFPPILSELDLDTSKCFGGASHDVCPGDNLEGVVDTLSH